ncbi:unnamed protein product [Notodromas monacha]|uniref:Uncharacterized protein n=1 Tax=Notodromas monacha TaxID=399045 RepID=A0A7R9BQT6_9CRUS|nr:unnamed protein product [Notodromas monacha]CAG0918478.1 unnamed protein product [Notodromas monacha]
MPACLAGKLRSGKHHHATAFTSGSQQAHDRSSFTSIVPEEEPSLASAPGDRVVFSGGHVDFDQPPPPPDPPTTTTTTTNNSAGKSGKGRAAQAYIKWQKPTAAPVAANCSSCASHEQLVRVRLGMIKQRILSRLGYVRSLPDASYRDIPKNSPLQKLIEDFSMQSDSPAMGLRPGDANAHYDDGEGDAQIQSMYVVARTLASSPPATISLRRLAPQNVVVFQTSCFNHELSFPATSHPVQAGKRQFALTTVASCSKAS